MAESTQVTLETRRAPRVHIKYEVRVGNKLVDKELPFVVGVMGDYSGNFSSVEKKPLSEREFIDIRRENFDDVMKSIGPGVNMRVKNTLADEPGKETQIQLNFKSMDDFEPGKIIEQVPQLKELLETRNKLRDLLTNAGIKPRLEARLEEILQNHEEMMKLQKEVGDEEKGS